MKKIFILISLFSFLVWGIDLFINPHQKWDIWVLRDEIVLLTGIMAFANMSLTMLLTTRFKWLEDVFNGLDKMYFVHKWTGILSISLGGFHYLIDYIGPNFLESIFGDHYKEHIPVKELAGIIGEYTFWIIVILSVLSLWNKFSYHIWIYSHKFMPITYLGIMFHAIILTPIHYWLQPVGIFIGICSLTGILSSLISLFGLIGKQNRVRGKITNINQLDMKTIEITCKLERNWSHDAGQYVFFKSGIAKETHPFTISSADNGKNEIKLSIKALGDYTKKLQTELNIGDIIFVEGPYGRFNFKNMKMWTDRQIWIGGGIGITPFVSWLESLQNDPDKHLYFVDIYYCVNKKQEDIFGEKLQALCNYLPNINLHIHYSDEIGFLTTEKLLPSKEVYIDYPVIYFCGPKLFEKTLKMGLRKKNISPYILHKEIFSMR